jgi:hypothetical protein
MTFAALLVSWFTGWFLVRAVWPGPLRLTREDFVRVPMGLGVGFVVTSLAAFHVTVWAGHYSSSWIGLDLALLALAAAAAWLHRGETAAAPIPSTPPSWLKYAAALAAALALVGVIIVFRNQPHGEWDAWSIWNLKARFLFRGGPYWTAMFERPLAYAHPDYPLFLPSLVARTWVWAGEDTTAVPVWIAALILAAAATTLAATVLYLRGLSQALLVALAACGTSLLFAHGTSQYADVPVGYFFLSAGAAWALARESGRPALYLLAGFFAGAAAWTKNEGQLYALVFALAALVMLRREWRSFLWILVGALPALTTLVLFRLKFPYTNEMVVHASGANLLARLADPSRWVLLITWLLQTLVDFGGWIVTPVLVLGVYAWCVRGSPNPQSRASAFTLAAVALAALLGDLSVYLLLSLDLPWQLDTSFARVCMHTWPLCLLSFFLWANRLEDLAIPVEERKPKKKTK